VELGRVTEESWETWSRTSSRSELQGHENLVHEEWTFLLRTSEESLLKTRIWPRAQVRSGPTVLNWSLRVQSSLDYSKNLT
jgi:hypothetical protein